MHNHGAKGVSTGIGSGSQGITVASDAAADTLGTRIELITATPYACNGFTVTLTSYTFASASNVSFLFNIYTGADDEEIKVKGLHVYSDNSEANFSTQKWWFPLGAPKGTRISADCQSNTAAADAIKLILDLDVPENQSDQGYGGSVTYGDDVDTSNGATFDPGGTINAKGAWSEVTSDSEFDLAGFVLSIGANLNTAQDSANWLIDVGIGPAGDEEVIRENIVCSSTSQEKLWFDGCFKRVKIAKGERIAIRAASEETDATDRIRSYTFVGIIGDQA